MASTTLRPHIDAVLPPVIEDWFAARGWQLRRHQADMLDAAGSGEHALLVAATGAGKTLAGFLPTLRDCIENPRDGLRALYVSPLKALAADVQRNLLAPIHEMGLSIRVETRTGDTSSDARKRQRSDPPHILLTTPESLSLLLTYPESAQMLAGLETVIIDEVHAFAATKRGDLLTLALARLQRLNPALRRVALSATIPDDEAMRAWLAPGGDASSVRLVTGLPAAPPDISILVPDNRIPWAGHNARHAAREVVRLIERHRLAIVFVNTRAVAELVFRDLWSENEGALPIGIHHGSLSAEARHKVEAAMAAGKLRAIVATASLDLGIDWGDVDLVVQMGAPKGASRMVQRVGRANHRMDESSKAVIVPGNRFEYLESLAALDAVAENELDAEPFRPGSLDVLAQHVMGLACADPFDADELLAEIRSSWSYRDLSPNLFARVLGFIESGGYSLRVYDRFKRLTQDRDGKWRVTHPRLAKQHRMNAGVIVEAPAVKVRLGGSLRGGGRVLGSIEEWFASQLRVGDRFMFAGLTLEITGNDGPDLVTRLGRGDPSVPTYVGGRMPLSTNLANRVRRMLADRADWRRFPPEVRQWLRLQDYRSRIPQPDELLIETFPRDGKHFIVIYGFEGRHAHQSLGMLLTQRMEARGLNPLGFVATDYVVAVWSLNPIPDPQALLSPEILADELEQWIEATPFLKRAFRDVAVISGLIERQIPGKAKTGKQVMFSTDLIFDVLRKYEPEHLLLEAAWNDARARLTDIARLQSLLERAQSHAVIERLHRASPLSIPVLLEAGRETIHGAADEALLAEAAALDDEEIEVGDPDRRRASG